MTVGKVETIQLEQLALFKSLAVEQSLRLMRKDAELEEIRFLHRLKPFKLEVQLKLLVENGFDPTAEGLVEMERSIAAHMASTPAVGTRGKDLMRLIMGEIWPDAA